MSTLKTNLEIISAIEQTFDVNTIQYKGLILWPLIRLSIFQQLSHPDMNYTGKTGCQNISALKANKQQINLLKKYYNSDLLFFSTYVGADRHEQIEGKYYHPYTDWIIDLTKNKYSNVKVELISEKAKKTVPRFYPTVFVTPDLDPHTYISREPVQGFASLNSVVQECTGFFLDEDRFINQANHILSLNNYFMEILHAIKPKIAFLICYYYVIAMAFIKASKNMKIPTIDVQHGVTGDYHGLYTHWTRIPEFGYDLLPDYFWCWGKSTKDSIEKWYPPDTSNHRPVIGGNLRFLRWFKDKDPYINKEISNFYDVLNMQNKVILLTLQDQNLIPSFVLQTMKDSPDDWLWLLRLHPSFSDIDRIKKLDKTAKEFCSNFEIVFATFCPLFGLLKRCSHHITVWSATFYDAFGFNVPTTIVGKLGLEVYGNYIEKGVLSYADNAEELLASIQNFSNKHFNVVDFLDTNELTAENLINSILNDDIKINENLQEARLNHVNSMNQLGEILFKKGFYKASYRIFSNNVEAMPTFALSHNNLGVFFWKFNKIDIALQCFINALTYSQKDFVILSNIFKIFRYLKKVNV